MSNGTTKPKPKTIDEWRSERRRKAKREGGFILIPLEMWNGEAFHVLTKAEKLILLECMSQVRYAPRSSKKRANLPKDKIYSCTLGHLLNRGEFGLPTKYLQERGIKGEDTISRAKKRLVEIGFIDVVDQGSFAKAGRFRYSDRWRSYNAGALSKENGSPMYDGPLPGYCHYPNIIQFNKARAEQKSSILSNEEQTQDYNQLELFPELVDAA
ncbi:hypothetical protein [Desulfomonile tiedjei]|uniref:Helix-turn-helix domain-containing protein n=1 Tax=Desulfomonile tiedjei (strain ATCC 49306 / DSM 6799 / DCB-1) TaxID=706587 RepID=I4C190_DESTA|nr:hypothetical protein [Desulfomonile tiedjei]AFM23331.1 hypothetical protein Desti_0603 [Desulfomonile tiedjei DSM 6799]